MHYSIMTTAMTLRRLGCALCMPFISPFRSSFRSYNRAYAYRGLTAFAPLSMAVSGSDGVPSLPGSIGDAKHYRHPRHHRQQHKSGCPFHGH
ncbi:MAG: hypothetical protein KZQ60_12795 [Candidatus Thiodiazotropha sp. (ex Lucinoma aequizonata)]|nr:hypothetical protein [Candidatus Thiodiazotropha sp. (ex Lucinoma aequizonata)]